MIQLGKSASGFNCVYNAFEVVTLAFVKISEVPVVKKVESKNGKNSL